MKLAAQTKKPPPCPPAQTQAAQTAHQGAHQGGGQSADGCEELVDTGAPFLSLIRKAARITRKQLQFVFGWSKTYVDEILSGEKNDPLEQSRKLCAELRALNRADLVAAVVVYIAGGDDFDGRVLTAAQVDALKTLVDVVRK